MSEKEKLLDELLDFSEKEKYEELLNHWAASDVVIDYNNEIDFEIASIVTRAYVLLGDYANAYYYSKFQIDYIINVKPQKIDEINFYLVVLINYFTEKDQPLKAAKVLIEGQKYKLQERLEKAGLKHEQSALDIKIDNIATLKKYRWIHWLIAGILLVMYAYIFNEMWNHREPIKAIEWIKDGIFYAYAAFVLIRPFRRWLIKGWVKQWVKIY